MEFSWSGGGEDVADCIIVGGVEKACEVVVVAIRTVEFFKVPSLAVGGADIGGK